MSATREDPKQLVLAKIADYFTYDNPYPETVSYFTTVLTIFSGSTAAGRIRAEQYKNIINGLNHPAVIIDAVFSDVLNHQPKSSLENSKKLRLRMLEALCQYYQIEEEVALKLHQTIITFRGYAVIVPATQIDRLKTQLMVRLVKREMTNDPQLKTQNNSFRQQQGG